MTERSALEQAHQRTVSAELHLARERLTQGRLSAHQLGLGHNDQAQAPARNRMPSHSAHVPMLRFSTMAMMRPTFDVTCRHSRLMQLRVLLH